MIFTATVWCGDEVNVTKLNTCWVCCPFTSTLGLISVTYGGFQCCSDLLTRLWIGSASTIAFACNTSMLARAAHCPIAKMASSSLLALHPVSKIPLLNDAPSRCDIADNDKAFASVM